MNDLDQTQAFEEGWCISECSGSHYIPEGWFDIQRLDEADRFRTDREAQAYVFNKAAEGSEYHLNAVKMWEDVNFRMVRRLQQKQVREYLNKGY